VPNFGLSEGLIRMTDETPLLLAPREQLAALNIFDKKSSVDFPAKVDWSMEWVDLVAPDGLIFLLMDLFVEAELVSGSHTP
jgi:hypothetical protein